MNLKLFKTIKNSKLHASKFLYIAPISTIIAVSSLTGCNNSANNNNQEINMENIEETKIFEPGQHILFKEYKYKVAQNGDGDIIEVPEYPEEYRILNAEYGHSHGLAAYARISFINEVPVICHPDDKGAYTIFGTSIEPEKSLSLKNSSN